MFSHPICCHISFTKYMCKVNTPKLWDYWFDILNQGVYLPWDMNNPFKCINHNLIVTFNLKVLNLSLQCYFHPITLAHGLCY